MSYGRKSSKSYGRRLPSAPGRISPSGLPDVKRAAVAKKRHPKGGERFPELHPASKLLPPSPATEREFRTFVHLKPQLLKDPRYAGKYVAILNGKVVDSDSKKLELALRVQRKFPNEAPFVAEVSGKERIIEIPWSLEFATPASPTNRSSKHSPKDVKSD